MAENEDRTATWSRRPYLRRWSSSTATQAHIDTRCRVIITKNANKLAMPGSAHGYLIFRTVTIVSSCPSRPRQFCVLDLAVTKIASPAARIRFKFLSYRLVSKGIKVRQFR